MSETVDTITQRIKNHAFSFADEDELQRGLAEVMPETAQREVRLTPRDRIDFLVDGIGIEVKLAGSISALTRQLHRYAQSRRSRPSSS